MLKINKINLKKKKKKEILPEILGLMLEDLRCVSKFHISNLTPLMLAAGISPYGSCCRQQVTLQPPILKGLSEMYPTVAAHF